MVEREYGEIKRDTSREDKLLGALGQNDRPTSSEARSHEILSRFVWGRYTVQQ